MFADGVFLLFWLPVSHLQVQVRATIKGMAMATMDRIMEATAMDTTKDIATTLDTTIQATTIRIMDTAQVTITMVRFFM